MTQRIEGLRPAALKWRAGKSEYSGGVVFMCEGEVYDWKNELRDPASERPVYALDGRASVPGRKARRLQRRESLRRH